MLFEEIKQSDEQTKQHQLDKKSNLIPFDERKIRLEIASWYKTIRNQKINKAKPGNFFSF